MFRMIVVLNGVDPQLARALADGTYVVDPRAVADAMLQRENDRAEARRLSRVLVAAKRDRAPFPVKELEPGSGSDLS
jgi:hypothetical protein